MRAKQPTSMHKCFFCIGLRMEKKVVSFLALDFGWKKKVVFPYHTKISFWTWLPPETCQILETLLANNCDCGRMLEEAKQIAKLVKQKGEQNTIVKLTSLPSLLPDDIVSRSLSRKPLSRDNESLPCLHVLSRKAPNGKSCRSTFRIQLCFHFQWGADKNQCCILAASLPFQT